MLMSVSEWTETAESRDFTMKDIIQLHPSSTAAALNPADRLQLHYLFKLPIHSETLNTITLFCLGRFLAHVVNVTVQLVQPCFVILKKFFFSLLAFFATVKIC